MFRQLWPLRLILFLHRICASVVCVGGCVCVGVWEGGWGEEELCNAVHTAVAPEDMQ